VTCASLEKKKRGLDPECQGIQRPRQTAPREGNSTRPKKKNGNRKKRNRATSVVLLEGFGAAVKSGGRKKSNSVPEDKAKLG